MVTDGALPDAGRAGQIDRSSPVPLYHQLEFLLRKEIDSGHYGPGDPLPSEGEICARYDVSRSVVRQALTSLTQVGLVHTERGRGSFVAERKLPERFVQRTTGLYDDLRRLGYDVGTRVVLQTMCELPLPAQEFLGTEHGVQIDRVRSVEGRVLAYIRSYFSADKCPGIENIDLADRSLYGVLADKYGLRLGSGRRTIEAVAVRGEIARYLEVDDGEPVLLLRSGSRDEQGEPLEWFDAWHRGDRTLFEIEITPGEIEQTVSSVIRPAPDGRPTATTSFSETLRQSGVLAVWRAPSYRSPGEIARVLAQHRITVVEITTSGDHALDAITEVRDVPGITVGAGIVTTAAEARSAVRAGAQFLVAPVGAQEVVGAAGSVPVLMTGFTPAEVWRAWQATYAPVKVLPGKVGGPGYLSVLRDAVPGIALVPSGDLDIDNALDYLRAGATAVALDEPLTPGDALVNGDLQAVGERADAVRRALDTLSGERSATPEGR